MVTVLVDIDGVLCRLVSSCLERYNKENGTDYREENCIERDQVFGDTDIGKIVRGYLKDDHFTESMYPFGDALKPLEQLNADPEIKVYIATSRSFNCRDSTIQWFANVGIEYDKVFVLGHTKKHRLKGDILIDDHINNVIPWIDSRNYRMGILFSRPWNSCDWKRAVLNDYSRGYIVTNWEQALFHIMDYKNNRDGGI